MPRRVTVLEAAPDSDFKADASHRILWEGHPIARLRPGHEALRPRIEVLDSAFLGGAERERVRIRLQRFLDAMIADALAPLLAATANPAWRGPLHRLREGLGVVPGPTELDIPPGLRADLKAAGVKAGRFALFMPALLKPRALAMRATLLALARGIPTPALPTPSLVTLPRPATNEAFPETFLETLGWVAAGPVWIRLDVAERLAAELVWITRAGPMPIQAGLDSRLSVRTDMLPAVLRGLGLRVLPGAVLGSGEFGPPAPAMMAPRYRRHAPPQPEALPSGQVPKQRVVDGPFAALAALRVGR
jgi:ATP-dependent RNA helicase SUPV3L1/SUV3